MRHCLLLRHGQSIGHPIGGKSSEEVGRNVDFEMTVVTDMSNSNVYEAVFGSMDHSHELERNEQSDSLGEP